MKQHHAPTETLDISDNKKIRGLLPTELGRLDRLGTFKAHSMSLSGEIPFEFGNMSKIQWFELSNNNLNGTIPSTLGMLSWIGVLPIMAFL